jgi:SNF2 family DNA or RNA helicase
MPKKTAAAIIKDVENVDDATAMMSKLSVAVKETKKKKEANPLSVNETNPPVPAQADPSSVAVEDSSSGATDQLKYLDQMFDDQARVMRNIKLPPDVEIRQDLLETKLKPHQVQGVKWLIKQEINSDPCSLYKEVSSNSGAVRHTPPPIKGAILADEYVCFY